MSMQHTTRSVSRRKFTGRPLKLPHLDTNAAMAIEIENCVYSPGSYLRRVCFEDPLTPLSSEADHDDAFDTSIMTDKDAYSHRSWLERICFEDPLTPLSSEGDSFDSIESGSSDFSTDQIQTRLPLSTHRPSMSDDGRLPPPALTRERTYKTFDGPLTSLESGTGMEEGERRLSSLSVESASQTLRPTSNGKTNTYTKPQASAFDAAHACEWFPDPPPVPDCEIVVSNFADLKKFVQFPPSAWTLGRDGRLVRNYDVTFENPSLPIAGPLPVTGVVERERRALKRQREEATRVFDLEDSEMRGIDYPDMANFEDNDMEPKPLGPEGTEIYDGVSDYPEEWASNQSTRLCYHPTEELVIE